MLNKINRERERVTFIERTLKHYKSQAEQEAKPKAKPEAELVCHPVRIAAVDQLFYTTFIHPVHSELSADCAAFWYPEKKNFIYHYERAPPLVGGRSESAGRVQEGGPTGTW